MTDNTEQEDKLPWVKEIEYPLIHELNHGVTLTNPVTGTEWHVWMSTEIVRVEKRARTQEALLFEDYTLAPWDNWKNSAGDIVMKEDIEGLMSEALEALDTKDSV